LKNWEVSEFNGVIGLMTLSDFFFYGQTFYGYPLPEIGHCMIVP